MNPVFTADSFDLFGRRGRHCNLEQNRFFACLRSGITEIRRSRSALRGHPPGGANARLLLSFLCGISAALCIGLLAPGFVCAALSQSPPAPQPLPTALPTITTAREAHSLTTEQALRGYPVHLRGVVSCTDPSTGPGHAAMFVYDATGGLYVMIADELNGTFLPGTLVDVRGESYPGSFAPIIVKTKIHVIGPSHLPDNPPNMSLRELETGDADAEWVEVDGIVHAVVDHGRFITLQLAMKDGVIGVSMLREAGGDYARLIDARVRIHGNAAPMFNRNDQVMGARLMAPGLFVVQVLDPAPPDPFLQPITRIDDLLRWNQLATMRHRVHLRGSVTMLWPGSSFCIRDESRGICAQSVQGTQLAIGEVADVTGFAAAEDGIPVLTDAIYRSTGERRAVSARVVTAEQALLGKAVDPLVEQKSRADFDSELIEVYGQLVGNDVTSSDTVLVLTSGQTVFTALLPRSLAGSNPGEWKVGSKLRVTGICSVRLDAQSRVAGKGVADAKSFRVLMRSPDDVVILRRPSWWTPSHAAVVLALALTATLVVLCWVVALRRRLEHQTRLIRESESRFRHMAQHDALTGLANRPVLHHRLSVAMELARRNHTVLAVLMLDVDNFKHINDTCGHDAGDAVLRVTATRLVETLRNSDTVARMGGDEFVVLLPNLREPLVAESLAAKLVCALAVPISFAGNDIPVSVSIGVCTASEGALSSAALLKCADAALYQAKARGRNCFHVFSPDLVRVE